MRFRLALAVLSIGLARTASAAVQAPLPDCEANQLSLTFDGEGGAFDGMSHGGTLMVLRNIGPGACKVPAVPALLFRDAAGHPVDMARAVPPGLHPGPVVRPVGLAGGAEATAPLRWVAADVYDGHHCVTPATVSIAIGSETLTQGFATQVCGPPGRPVPYEQPWLRTDPVLAPASDGRP